MKKIILLIGILVAIAGMFITTLAQSQPTTSATMKMNAGIITNKLQETKIFYQHVFHFGVSFENEFYLLMHTPDGRSELSFLQPNHPSQQPVFQMAFSGKGVYLTIEVPNVDEEYKRIKLLGIPIEIELRNEPWGDRHFAIVDPNGVGIDVVTYSSKN